MQTDIDFTRYYCYRCQKEVKPVFGKWRHIDLGIVPGLVCPICSGPVMVKT